MEGIALWVGGETVLRGGHGRLVAWQCNQVVSFCRAQKWAGRYDTARREEGEEGLFDHDMVPRSEIPGLETVGKKQAEIA